MLSSWPAYCWKSRKATYLINWKRKSETLMLTMKLHSIYRFFSEKSRKTRPITLKVVVIHYTTLLWHERRKHTSSSTWHLVSLTTLPHLCIYSAFPFKICSYTNLPDPMFHKVSVRSFRDSYCKYRSIFFIEKASKKEERFNAVKKIDIDGPV